MFVCFHRKRRGGGGGGGGAYSSEKGYTVYSMFELPSILAYCPQQHKNYRIMRSNSVRARKGYK